MRTKATIGHSRAPPHGAAEPWLLGMLLLLIGAIMAAALPKARAVDVEVAGRVVSRTVLALYDSKQEGPPHQTRLHKLAEMPLNHLGFMLEYRDINAPLPASEDLARYRGVITWFVEPLTDPIAYMRWLEPALATKLRYVMLGEIAPRETDELMRPINRVLAPLGLVHGGLFVDLTYRSKIASQNTAMIGFEQKLDKALPGFPLMLKVSSELEAHLTIDADTPEVFDVVLQFVRESGLYEVQVTFLTAFPASSATCTICPAAPPSAARTSLR